MITHLFLKGRLRHLLSAGECARLESAVARTVTVPERTRVIARGERIDVSTYLIRGVMLRSNDDLDGGRQLLNIQIAGDFVDLHGFPMKRLDHDVGTLTECEIAVVPHDALRAIMAEEPHLARLLWFSTLLDAAMHREWIFRLGRLGADGRLAHFFCELNVRLEMVGLAENGRFELPLTQPDLAEACGLTGVHVNRVLRDLRERNLMTFRSGQVEILDVAGLASVAEFESDYLYADMSHWTTVRAAHSI